MALGAKRNGHNVTSKTKRPQRHIRNIQNETATTSHPHSHNVTSRTKGHNVTSAPRTSAADEFLRFRSRVNHAASSRRWDVGARALSVMQDQAEDLVRDGQVVGSDRPKDKRLREAVRLVAVRLGGKKWTNRSKAKFDAFTLMKHKHEGHAHE